MYQLTCCIIEKNIEDNSKLARKVSNSKTLELKEVFTDAKKSIPYLNINKVDVLFLNLESLPEDYNIFLGKLNNTPQIILNSDNKKNAIFSFQKNITDYLIKPISNSSFHLAISNANEKYRNNKIAIEKEGIFIKNDGKLVYIKYNDILYFESNVEFLDIHTIDAKYSTYGTMKNFELKLPSFIFMKIHRSFIINLSKINFIKDNEVNINDVLIPIARSTKKDFFKKLNLL